MKKVAWVTDSSAVLDEELKNHPHVYVLPVHLIINGQSYLDGVDLTKWVYFLAFSCGRRGTAAAVDEELLCV